MKAMILAAGYGKRLAPITDTIPKPLIKVGNMSLIDRNINYLVKSGFHEIIINVSHHADQIINHVNKNFSELNILFINFQLSNLLIIFFPICKIFPSKSFFELKTKSGFITF